MLSVSGATTFILEWTTLREAISRELRTRIIQGRLPGETRLAEPELAREFGVGRTPLREALIALKRDGFLTSSTCRGFSVQTLSPDEVQEIYPIYSLLAGFALTLCPPLGRRQRLELESLNEQVRACMDIEDEAKRAEVRVPLDRRWHRLLIAECPNRKLRDMLAVLNDQLLRCEYTYCMSRVSPLISFEEHQAIMEAMARGEPEIAAKAMQAHWNAAVERLVPGMGDGTTKRNDEATAVRRATNEK